MKIHITRVGDVIVATKGNYKDYFMVAQLAGKTTRQYILVALSISRLLPNGSLTVDGQSIAYKDEAVRNVEELISNLEKEYDSVEFAETKMLVE